MVKDGKVNMYAKIVRKGTVTEGNFENPGFSGQLTEVIYKDKRQLKKRRKLMGIEKVKSLEKTNAVRSKKWEMGR